MAATVTLASGPWAGTDLIAHQAIEVHWEDLVTLGEGDTNHPGHSDRVVIKDDADRVVVDELAHAPETPGGTVHLLHRIESGLREGLYTVDIYVAGASWPSGQVALPVTYSGEGVARVGEEYRLEVARVVPGMDMFGAEEPIGAGRPFHIGFVLHNHGPHQCPSNRRISVRVAGSGGTDEGETETPQAIEPGTSMMLQHLVVALPAGVYRVEVWADLVTTMSPVFGTIDFTVPEAPI